MAMTQQEVVDYWLDKAIDDLKAAKVLYASKMHLHTGFMCQQCIEKALKAYFIYAKDKRHPHQHNVEILAEMTNLLDSMNDDQKQVLKKLVPLYIETRYEDEKNLIAERLTRPYCKDLLSDTEVLFEWILQLMK